MNFLKEEKKKSYKFVFPIIFVSTLALLMMGVFYITYNVIMNDSSSSYEKSIRELAKKVNETNKKVAAFNKDKTVDTELTKKDLPAYIDDLLILKSDIQDETPTEKFRVSQLSLLQGVSSNILIYRQILSIIQNPNSSDIDKSVNDLDKYKAECISNYQNFIVRDIKVQLPSETLTFIESSTNYALELIKTRKQIEIKVAQNQDFIDKMDAVIANFIPLKSDFTPQLQKLKESVSAFDDVLNFFDQTSDKYLNLKKDFAAISIPEKTTNKLYNTFNSLLDDYALYLQEMKFSVKNQKLKTKDIPLDNDSIKVIYASAMDKYNTLDTNYNTFLKSYTDFKNNK